MEASKSSFHVRSNSFPSKSHPLLQQGNEQLERLQSSDATSSSSSSIYNKLSGVEDLFDCVEKLLQLQFAQQSLSQARNEKWVDKFVDGSLRLLDLCSVAKDAVLHTKECAREVQSAMRRKRGAEDRLEIEIKKYSASRKVVKKTVQKALKGFKSNVVELPSSPTNQDNETKALIDVLRGVETVALSVFQSLLWFISGPKRQAKISGWSLVSKLMHNKRNDREEEEVNEFVSVDASLHCLVMNHEKVRSDLQNLDLCIQEFEEKLDLLFRRLIKTRVALLNVLNN